MNSTITAHFLLKSWRTYSSSMRLYFEPQQDTLGYASRMSVALNHLGLWWTICTTNPGLAKVSVHRSKEASQSVDFMLSGAYRVPARVRSSLDTIFSQGHRLRSFDLNVSVTGLLDSLSGFPLEVPILESLVLWGGSSNPDLPEHVLERAAPSLEHLEVRYYDIPWKYRPLSAPPLTSLCVAQPHNNGSATAKKPIPLDLSVKMLEEMPCLQDVFLDYNLPQTESPSHHIHLPALKTLKLADDLPKIVGFLRLFNKLQVGTIFIKSYTASSTMDLVTILFTALANCWRIFYHSGGDVPKFQELRFAHTRGSIALEAWVKFLPLHTCKPVRGLSGC